MSQTFDVIQSLVSSGRVRVSSHGYDELAEDGIMARDLIESIQDGSVVEDYPTYGKGPCVLILQHDRNGNLIHAVWGIPKGKKSPAVLVTAYRPDPKRWSDGFLRRRS